MDRGKSYELKEWDDVEQGTTLNDTTRESQEVILGEEDLLGGKKNRGMWRKGGSSTSNSQTRSQNKDDMTITKTSEVELQISSASDRYSKRLSRNPTPRRDTP
jgi:hypothetical protein